MGKILAFPTEVVRDPYVKFKTDETAMNTFNEALLAVMENLREFYPELDPETCDFALMAESMLAMIMRTKGIEHPLHGFSETVGAEFLEEYS